MRQIVIIVFLLVTTITSFGQGLMELPLPPLDTAEYKMDSLDLEASPLLHQNILLNNLNIQDLNIPKLNLPDFNFNTIYSNRWQIDESNSLQFRHPYISPAYILSGSPLIRDGVILNQAAYKISDKFVLGGNSFAGNSIFSAPMPNQGGNYDFKGASMFMQYKVSKNFKIETRVSVTNGSYPHP